MRVRIYSEPRSGAIGGSEVSAAVLAAGLAAEHDVELVHNNRVLTRESLATFAAVDLAGVTVKRLPLARGYKGPFWKVVSRYRAEQSEDATLTGDCDVFIAFVHEPPPFCAAKRGILWILFPFHPLNDPNPAKRLWYKWKLQARLRGYQTRLAISGFAQKWTLARWNSASDILFPPVQLDAVEFSEKTNRILSVGRFATDGHGKKQIEMLGAYSRVRQAAAGSWSYHCLGGCGSSAAELAFFEEARCCGREAGATVTANVTRDELRAAYAASKIFWHAAGLGIDEDVEPERTEHFGISTVEAMAAGCVPVVINKGGQREIVEHEVSGFLWDTLDELQQYTLQLMEDEDLRRRMSSAARERAQKFGRDEFVRQFISRLPASTSAAETRNAGPCAASAT